MSRNSRQYRSMPFHGLKRNGYFEGWYYKQVSSDEKTIICFIPGVSARDGTVSPFIQAILARLIGDVWEQTTDWLDVPAFQPREEPFSLRLGE